MPFITGLKQAAVADRFAFSDSFLATLACIDTWLTDFRADLPKIEIPVLAVHGTADRVLPSEVTTASLRDERLTADLTVVEIDDGLHDVGWTHSDRVNSALVPFLGSDLRDSRGAIAATGQM